MTTLTKTFIFAALATSVVTLATPAQAQANSFNKFPVSATHDDVKGVQTAIFSQTEASTSTISTTKPRVKRVVQPLPQTRHLDLSNATDTGTTSLDRGFNKMRPNKLSPARPMKIIVDERAYSAR